jgi:Na+-driven multidrug efflux pump
MVAVLARGRSALRLKRSSLPLQREPARRVLRIGLPAASDGAVMWTGQFLFLMVVARLGTGDLQFAYYAAHMIGVRLEALMYLPATAWSIAAATMIGQNLGAEQPARARRSGHEAALQCGLLAVGVALLFYVLARVLFALMHLDPLVHAVGVGPFRILAWFQPLLALSIVYTGALRGAGDTRFPLLITFVGVTLLRLPLAWWLGIALGWGLLGAWLAMCADFALRTTLAAARFARGKWIRIKV